MEDTLLIGQVTEMKNKQQTNRQANLAYKRSKGGMASNWETHSLKSVPCRLPYLHFVSKELVYMAL